LRPRTRLDGCPLRLKCRFGLHTWDQNVPEQDRWLIKQTGLNVAFSSSGIQKARQRCQHCSATRMVYRNGWISTALMPSTATPWRRCAPWREQEIDDLPVL
jgi:hypothetical protein